MRPILRLALLGMLQFFYILLLFQAFGRNKLVDNGVHNLSMEVGDGFADIIGIQHTVPLDVDHLTLLAKSSYSSRFLRISKLQLSTLRWALSMALVTMRCSKPQQKAHKCYVFLSVCYLISETKPLSEKSQSKIDGECFHDA